MGQKHRSSEEIDFDILKLLTINPSGIRLSTLICKVGLNDVKGKERLLGLERRKLLKIDEIKQRLSHSKSGRRLLSDNPKEITRRIVRTTRKGNSFFKKKNLAGLTVSAF